jgi:hypothetical protein
VHALCLAGVCGQEQVRPGLALRGSILFSPVQFAPAESHGVGDKRNCKMFSFVSAKEHGYFLPKN